MKYYSTNKKSVEVDLKTAVLSGMAPDGGLYMPEYIPALDEKFFKQYKDSSFPEVALSVAKVLFSGDIPDDVIENIVTESFDFDVPIVELEKGLYVLELFHGPTGAFKDFAARFMSRLFGYYLKDSAQDTTVLVATSGDTGGAVAHGFLNVEGVNVIILYPSGKVSRLQEKQLTTMGGNILALEIAGSFDDCQAMVKKAFLDSDLKKKIVLASANSINIARLLPQIFYYAYLATKLKNPTKPAVVSVPSGNFGNLTAGLMAKRMGAPIDKFIASTNVNDTVPEYLKTGEFKPKSSVQTISNAMDVGNPSNFTRIQDLYKYDVAKINQDIFGASFTDSDTKEAMKNIYDKQGYFMDPHGAVAYLGLAEFRNKHPEFDGYFVETADPAKFGQTVEEATGHQPPMPKRFEEFLKRPKVSYKLLGRYEDLKKFILSNC